MIQRLIINGQPEYIEFVAKVETEDVEKNRRLWTLKNGVINFKFIEEPIGQFLDFSEVPANVEMDEDTKEELKVQIYEIIDRYTEQQRSGIEPEPSDEITQDAYPYDPKQIAINSFNWSVDYIFQLINRNVINLSPDFQRNFVWDYKRKSQLIESILLGIPVPAFYLSKSNKGYQVVDGLQRLTSIKQFINNEFPLKYLEYLNESQESKNNLEGCYFKSDGKRKGLSEDYEFLLKGTQFNVNVIEEKTPTQVKFDVFRRLNTGGKPLNKQEIRNCMMEDQPRNLINKLANSPAFRKATGDSVSATRMDSQELVMRFIGFWYLRILKNPEISYQGNMQSFLDEMTDRLNKDEGKYHPMIERDFIQGMENAFYLFGQYCFRKCLPAHLKPDAKKQLINKSLFTTWSVLLSSFSPNKIKSLVTMEGFASILANALIEEKTKEEIFNYFQAVSYRTNDKAVLDTAFAKAEKLIKTYLK